MNKKIVLAFVLGAFALAACNSPAVDVSVLWTKKTAAGTESVSKETSTIYSDENGFETYDKSGTPTTTVSYIHKIEYPGGGSRSSSVEPCGGGFCDENGKDVTKVASSEPLDNKNARVSRERRSSKGFASNQSAEEPGVDGGGGSY